MMKSIQTVVVALLLTTAGSMVLAAEAPTFDQLDTNKDGHVSIGEASMDSSLSSKWSTADTNKDGVIERSEFSAFETLQKKGPSSNENAPAKAPGAAN